MSQTTVFLLFFFSLWTCDLEAAIDLNSAFNSALKKNEAPLIQNSVRERAKEKKTQAIGSILPDFTAGAQQFHEDTSKLAPNSGIFQDTTTTRLTLTQPLFHGFREFSGLRAANALVRAETAATEQVKSDLFDQVAQSFYNVLTAEKDGGNTWARSQGSSELGDINSSYGWWFGHVAVDPKNSNTVYVVAFGIEKSTDGGNSFSDWASGLHPDNHALYFVPGNTNAIFVGNDSGLYLREGTSLAFTHFNLPITQFYSMAFDPTHPEHLYAGAQDNGTVRTKTGAVNDWQSIYQSCDGFEVQVDPRNSNTVFAECQYGSLGKSENGAQSFTDISIPFVRAGWEMPIRLGKANPDILYAGGESLYMSPDQGTNWKKISPDLTTGTSTTAAITTFDVSIDSKVIYAGTDNGHAWVTRDGGANWAELKGLPNRWITRIRGRPNNPAEVFVTVSGFRWGETAAQVFKSVDYGTTWIALDGGLPDAPVNDILFDNAQSNKMYLANDFGVYVTVDGGLSWKPFGSGIPITSIVELKIDTNNNLLAVTHGRGIYRLNLSAKR